MPDEKPATSAELRAALDAAVETIAGEISAFRTEVNARFAAVDRQFEAVHSRLDRSTEILTLLQGSTVVLNSWADRTDRLAADHQRAVDQTIAEIRRLDALEKKAS